MLCENENTVNLLYSIKTTLKYSTSKVLFKRLHIKLATELELHFKVTPR